MDYEKEREKMKVKAKDKFEEIIQMISSFDGISSGDAIRLGLMINEFAHATAAEAVGEVMATLMSSLVKPEPKQPWEK